MALEQALTLRAIDKFTGPAKKIANAGDELSRRLGAGQKSIAALGRDNKAIERMQGLERRLGSTSSEMAKARNETARLGREMASTANPTRTLQRQFESARRKSDRLKQEHRQQRDQLRTLREQLRGAGIDTRNLGAAQAGIQGKIESTTSAMRRMADASARVDAAQGRFDAALQRQAHATIAAAGIHRVGTGIMRTLSGPLSHVRRVEAARGELQSLGIADTQAIIDRGREISTQLAGIDTAAFTSAAYDIKSGISTLTDSGVAEMTAVAALTAKATKAEVGQMTSLFATAYGTYKDTLFADLSDAEFGDRFSASLAASVQQFKTTGAGMQQAMQSMGSGLAAAGVGMEEQLAGLGMLQQKMESGVAGTTMRALARNAAQANQRFADMGFQIQTLDERGNLQSLPQLLEQMQATFGDTYSTEIGGILRQAFGSAEAVSFFEALWGQQDTFRANANSLRAAAEQGNKFTASMAAAMDNNIDARIQLMGQRWNAVQEKLGHRMIPILERLMPIIERGVDAISRFIDNNQGLATGILGLTGIVGGLALIAAPVIISVAALGTTLSWLGLQAAKANAAATMGAMGGGIAGKAGKGRGLRGMGGKLGVAGAATIGAISIGSTLMSDQSGTDKAATIAGDVGGLGGALAGAKGGALAGAAIGSVVPVLGTAIGAGVGGILGSIGGYMAGGWLGDKVGGGIKTVAGWFGSDNETGALPPGAPEYRPSMDITAVANSPAAQVEQAMAASGAGVTPPTPVQHTDHRQYHLQIAQQPGEDAESLARRVMDMLRREDDAHYRGALYDTL